LGLSICKQFVEMHDGKMWVESQLGVGTTFAFRLPVTTPAGLAADSESRNWLVNPYHQYEPRPRLYRAPLPKVLPRFILLEPGRALYRWFSRYLDNVELVVVDQPEAAVREIHDAPAQALIINAPPSQPTETLIGQLGEIPYITPIITCWVPGEDAFAQQLGVARYLVKPVSREMLLNALASIKGPVRQILVVDDEPEMLQLLGRMLISTEQDYQIIRASTGRQALELLRERRPDVMILDLVMPEVDGFQVIKEKSLDPALQAIPIIVVSANDPMGEPIISNTLTVTRSGGLSVRALLRSILALSETLIPAPTGPLSDDPTPPESLAG
jgi:CheY-like chemotaxis protein